jgi:hypothetical protein
VSGVGCSGEVRVARSEESFDKWGIEILVSYRDGDNLAILTGAHQSGGVTPILLTTDPLCSGADFGRNDHSPR